MGDNKYTLIKACNIVRGTDDSAGRLKVFMSVLRNSKSIRYSYNFYQKSPGPIKAALIVLYGLKCYLSLRRCRDDNPQLLYFASYPNEHRVLRHVRRHLNGISQGQITVSIANCFNISSIIDFLRFLPATARLYRFSSRLAGRYDFMPACRIFSTVTYYMRFTRLLDEGVKGVFIACQYSPECLGLATAAHRAGKKVLFTNHANAAGQTGYVAPLHADLLAVTSEAMADVYRDHTPHSLNIVPFMISEEQRAMQVPQGNADKLAVGIYLTALTNENRLNAILTDWSGHSDASSLFIRTHPAQVVNPDLSAIKEGLVSVEISRTLPLMDDIARTDIAVCGNSTVAIELLRGGRPVLYDHRLDDLAYDYNGYAAAGLVLPYPKVLDDSIFESLARHYLSDGWTDTMRYYDSGYQQNEQEIARRFSAAVMRALQVH